MAQYKVAVYIYPGGDLLDFTGPVEVYSASLPSAPSSFEITSFAHYDSVKSPTNALTYTPNASFKVVEATIAEYDILVIPGAHDNIIKPLIASTQGKELLSLIRKFATLPPREKSGKRFLQSVCTGAVILGAAGILANRTVTTHHLAHDLLKEYTDQAAGGDSKINILNKRCVDAGLTDQGVRIVNAAGVSSGIDTSLWIYEQFMGKEKANFVAEMVEFERRVEGWSSA